MTNGYSRFLRWTLTSWQFGRVQFSRRWLVVAIMLAAAGGSWQLLKAAKSELSPMEDRGVILIVINGPDGATLEYTAKYVNMLEKIGRKYSEFDKFFAVVGNPQWHKAQCFWAHCLGASAKNPRSTWRVK
jgi:multidrug efflux pump